MREVSKSKITLGIEIDDRRKKISLLNEALEKENARHNQQIEEINNHFQQELKQQSDTREITKARVVHECSQLLEEKKMIVAEINAICEEKKKVEDATVECVREIREKFQSKAKSIQETFKAEEETRTAKWLCDREKEIRRMTINGMRPEIQKILARYNAEKLQVDHDSEQQQKAFMDLEKKKIEDNLAKLNKDEEHLYNNKAREVKDNTQFKLNELRVKNFEDLRKLRELLDLERERLKEKHISNIKSLMNTHSDELTSLRRTECSHVLESRSSWLNQEETLIKSHEEEIEKLRDEIELKRRKFSEAIDADLNADREKRMVKTKTLLEEKTMAEIKRTVKEHELKKLQHDDISRMKFENQMSLIKEEFDCKNARVKKEISASCRERDSLRREIELLSEKVTAISTEEITLEDELKILHEIIAKKLSSRELATLKYQNDECKKRNAQEACFSSLLCKRKMALDKKESLELKHEENERMHANTKKEIETKHSEYLKQLESETIQKFTSKDAEITEILQLIKEEKTRLEHCQQLTQQYNNKLGNLRKS